VSRLPYPSPVQPLHGGAIGAFVYSGLGLVCAAGLFLLSPPGEGQARRLLSLLPAGSVPGVAVQGPGAEERGNPAARLLSGELAAEHWELTARFASGHFLFVGFLMTNIGFGDRNAAVSGYVIEPNGKKHRFHNGRREGEWILSPDRLHITVGASQLDLSHMPYRLQVDKQGLRLHMRFRPQHRAVWAEELAPPGYMLDVLDVAAPIEGTFWVRGMDQAVQLSGIATFTHSWTNDLGAKPLWRRIEFFSLHDECPFYAVDITAPNGARTHWTVRRLKGKEGDIDESGALTLSLTNEAMRSADSRYPVPGLLSFDAAGTKGQVALESLVLRDDPLGRLPRLFRVFVSLLLNLRPLRIWVSSPFTLSLWSAGQGTAHDSVSCQGTGVTAITFLNPMPLPQMERPVRASEVCGAHWGVDQPACWP